MTTGHAHFRITGDFVTSHARDLYGEQGWSQAARFLTESLNGLSHDEAARILRGINRVIGDESGMDLAEGSAADRAACQAMEAARYSGILQWRRFWWRPYAVVTVWGPDDAFGTSRTANKWHPPVKSAPAAFRHPDGTRRDFWSAARAVHYMDDPHNDRAVELRLDLATAEALGSPYLDRTMVLFGIVPEGPPTWVSPQTTWQEAFDVYVEAGYPIDVRGWSADTSTYDLRPWSLGPSDAAADFRRLRALDDQEREVHDQEREVQDFVHDQQEEIRITSVRPHEMKRTGGWVRPDGTAYACGYNRHKDLAGALVQKQGVDLVNDDPELSLYLASWMQIREDRLVYRTVVANKWGQPSLSQGAFWESFCDEHSLNDAGVIVVHGTLAELADIYSTTGE